MSHKIFICYRRDDTAPEAISIGQFLERELGRGSVFMDIDIHAGANFPVVLDQRLAQCKVLLALIGSDWLDEKNGAGRRLDDPEDWVRLEISRALARQIPVIPVCINRDELPHKAALPEDLQGLLNHQAAFVSTARFRNDMAGLVRDIRAIPDPLRKQRTVLIAALGLALLASGAVFIRHRAGQSHATQPPPATPVSGAPATVNHGVAQNPGQGDHADEKKKPAAAGAKEAPSPEKMNNTAPKATYHPLQGSIKFHSDQGDFIGGGQNWTFANTDGTFAGIFNGNRVTIAYHGDDNWDLNFAAPEGKSLAPGTYLNANRWPFNSPVKPGLEVSGAGRGCNKLTGQFTIRQLEYSGSKLQRFLADFEQHCEDNAPALSGTIELTAK